MYIGTSQPLGWGGVILDGDMLLVPKIIISILLAIALKYTIKSVSFLNEQLK